MPVVHLVASLETKVSKRILEGWWRRRWIGLRRSFPDCLVASLRLDHSHLAVETADPDRALRLFGNTVRNSTKGIGSGIWTVPKKPVIVRDRNHLLKTVRYILRNPLAEAGVDDPLEWMWSTLRDVVGAVVEPWCVTAELAVRLGRPVTGFDRWCLDWVSEGSQGAGRPAAFPQPAPGRSVPRIGLDDILAATEAATRWHRRDVRRKRALRWLFVALARHQGWRDVAALARVAEIRPRSIYRVGLTVPRRAIDAAALCLGDDRLLRALPVSSGLRIH